MSQYPSDAIELEAPTKPRGKALSEYYDGDSDGSEAETKAENSSFELRASTPVIAHTKSRERTPVGSRTSLDHGFAPPAGTLGSDTKHSANQQSRSGVFQAKGIVSESFAVPPNQQKVSPKKVFPPITSALEKGNDPSLLTDAQTRNSGIPRPGMQRRRMSQGKAQGSSRVPGLPKTHRDDANIRPPQSSVENESSISDVPTKASDLQKQKESNMRISESDNDIGTERLNGKVCEKKTQEKTTSKKANVTYYNGNGDVESIIAEKNRMIEQLKVEIRTLETVNRRYERDFIALSEKQDSMPKQIGGFQYEIRALKDRLRAFQDRVAVSERTIQNQEDYIIKLKAHCQKLESILKSKNLSENMIEDDERLKRQMEEKENSNKELRNQIRLLQEARESDYKRHKSLLKAAQSETAQIRKEMERLVQLTTERDNELKNNHIKLEREISKKKKELHEAQKLILAQQIQSQNAQVIPLHVPHGVSPPSAPPKGITRDKIGIDEITSKQQPNTLQQRPPRTRIPAPSKSPVKSGAVHQPRNEPTNEIRGPSEPTEELISIPEKGISKIPSSRKIRPRIDQPALSPVRNESPETREVVAQITTILDEKNENQAIGLTSYPSITSLPISSLAKRAQESVEAFVTEAAKQRENETCIDSQERIQDGPDDVQNTGEDARVIPGQEIEPNLPSESKHGDIEDNVLYDSENEKEYVQTPTKILDSIHISGNNAEHVQPEESKPVSVEDESKRVALVEEQKSIDSLYKDPLSNENAGDEIPEYSNDFQPDNEILDANDTLDIQEAVNGYVDEVAIQASPCNIETNVVEENAVVMEPEEDHAPAHLFRAENIGNMGFDLEDDDLPNIVNEQNRVVDEARWAKNPENIEPAPDVVGSEPLERGGVGDSPFGGNEAELSAPNHHPLISQDSVLKPEFGRPKKKYE